jgi:WD40-like Beta Propeller Repeat
MTMKLWERWAALCIAATLFWGCAADSDKGGLGGKANGNTAGTDGAGASGGTAGLSGSGIVAGSGAGTGSAGNGTGAADGGVIEPVNIDQCTTGNPAGLSDGDVATLMAGGAPGSLGYLYPYDKTVFPRGLIPPLVMWGDADDADAVFLHVKSKNFEYKLCTKPTAPGQLQLDAAVWGQAEARTEGSADPYTVELSVIKGGVARGPVTRQIIIAQATLKGSIFYNSYASALSPGAGSVLRVQPGKEVEVFIKGTSLFEGCNGCHAMSADGTRLVSNFVTSGYTNVYALDPTTLPMPPALKQNGNASFVGISPDGKVYVTNARTGDLGVRAGDTGTAQLLETDTGTEITGSGVPGGAMMPTFSSDGSLLVFNDGAVGDGASLTLMDFDLAMRKAENARTIYTSTVAGRLAGWPFVLPDNKAVVFQLGEARDFSGGNVGIDPVMGFGLFGGGGGGSAAPTVGPWGNLFLTDIASGKAVMLAKAMGWNSEADATDTAKSYLPFKTDELNMNYYPTVSPVAAGGYFWVFFDSERHYGNKGLHRQLWGTAVTISADGSYDTDPSNPAFYLTGQEHGTGNHRAFTALDPCKAEGDTCLTGIDCCGGFCFIPEDAATDEFGVRKGSCKKPEVDRCSNTDEACETTADCCNPNDSCIAGFCGQVIPE